MKKNKSSFIKSLFFLLIFLWFSIFIMLILFEKMFDFHVSCFVPLFDFLPSVPINPDQLIAPLFLFWISLPFLFFALMEEIDNIGFRRIINEVIGYEIFKNF